MPNSTAIVQLDEFGIGLLAALRLKGFLELDEQEERSLHAAFAKAYTVLCKELDKKTMRFAIILDPFCGRNWCVSELMENWREKELIAPTNLATIRRIRISEDSAQRYLANRAFGGSELWLKAAEAFIGETQLYPF